MVHRYFSLKRENTYDKTFHTFSETEKFSPEVPNTNPKDQKQWNFICGNTCRYQVIKMKIIFQVHKKNTRGMWTIKYFLGYNIMNVVMLM